MEPVSPQIPGAENLEVIYAKDQPQYTPVPAVRTESILITRWKLSDEERKYLIDGGDLFIAIAHFGEDLQPIKPMAVSPEEAMAFLVESGAPL